MSASVKKARVVGWLCPILANAPGDMASRQEVRHVLLVSAAEDALSGRSLAVSAGGKLEPVSGRESVVDEFADVITKGARELAR